MITVITPFQRKENIELLSNVLKGKANWIVLIDDESLVGAFPDWVTVYRAKDPMTDEFVKPPEREGLCKPNWLLNNFLANSRGKDKLDFDAQYMILCDDDSVEEGFFDKIPNEDVVCVSMKRGYDTLMAAPENMVRCKVGGEQVIMKGKLWHDYRYGLSIMGDGEMIEKVVQERKVTYVPDAYVLFNYFHGKPYSNFRRKPLALFIGDFWCAGNPRMGLSEWEGNIAHSFDSTELADVATFHFDKYFYHTGKRPDQQLVQSVFDINPDYIVLIIYKELGSDPTVMLPDTLGVLSQLHIPIITIWGDLEAEQQRNIANIVKKFTHVNVGTANRTAVESVGFKYMHVPKDSRIWNNPGKERTTDVLFFGSYGLGREERQFYLKYLLDNGVKLLCGGSEGRDHYTTEDYANGYKTAKIALSFSKAHGMNVVNARPFEAMSCGACLFEQKSEELAKMYTPGVDYVEWTDEVDLLNKVKYYLEHEDEREAIALSGQKKTEELYSAKSFWKSILDEAKR